MRTYAIQLCPPLCPTCWHTPEVAGLPSPIYTIGPLFYLAFTGEDPPPVDSLAVAFATLHFAPAKRTLEALEAAACRLRNPEMAQRFGAAEPGDAWRNILDARLVVDNLIAVARAFPEGTWKVWRTS